MQHASQPRTWRQVAAPWHSHGCCRSPPPDHTKIGHLTPRPDQNRPLDHIYLSTGPDIQFDPGYADPDISVDTNTSEALDHFPSNEQNHLAGTAAANLDVKSSGSNAHPPSKMSAKGLRNSFRKLVKPLVKKRTTEVEEGDVEGGSEESLLSRMGSSRWATFLLIIIISWRSKIAMQARQQSNNVLARGKF